MSLCGGQVGKEHVAALSSLMEATISASLSVWTSKPEDIRNRKILNELEEDESTTSLQEALRNIIHAEPETGDPAFGVLAMPSLPHIVDAGQDVAKKLCRLHAWSMHRGHTYTGVEANAMGAIRLQTEGTRHIVLVQPLNACLCADTVCFADAISWPGPE